MRLLPSFCALVNYIFMHRLLSHSLDTILARRCRFKSCVLPPPLIVHLPFLLIFSAYIKQARSMPTPLHHRWTHCSNSNLDVWLGEWMSSFASPPSSSPALRWLRSWSSRAGEKACIRFVFYRMVGARYESIRGQRDCAMRRRRKCCHAAKWRWAQREAHIGCE